MQTDVNPSDSLLAGFISLEEIKPGLTLITGPRGSGKTQWCVKVFDQASSLGLRVGGFSSPSVFENGKKIGIHLVDLSSGERRPLAYRRGSRRGDLLTTDWQMDVETLEWGNSVLEKAVDCDLFILDELGPLEFNHGVGLTAGFGIIEKQRNLPVFVSVRPSLLPEALLRWYWAGVLNVSTVERPHDSRP